MFLPREAAACKFFFPLLHQILQHFSGSGNSRSAVVSSKQPKRRKEEKNGAVLLAICLFPVSARRVQSAVDNHSL